MEALNRTLVIVMKYI